MWDDTWQYLSTYYKANCDAALRCIMEYFTIIISCYCYCSSPECRGHVACVNKIFVSSSGNWIRRQTGRQKFRRNSLQSDHEYQTRIFHLRKAPRDISLIADSRPEPWRIHTRSEGRSKVSQDQMDSIVWHISADSPVRHIHNWLSCRRNIKDAGMQAAKLQKMMRSRQAITSIRWMLRDGLTSLNRWQNDVFHHMRLLTWFVLHVSAHQEKRK